ncbi:MAG: hypothetical protein Q8N21_01880 [bacterium]|nr:hypothetical protein [bacterium]
MPLKDRFKKLFSKKRHIATLLAVAHANPKLRFISKFIRIKYIVVGIIGILVFVPVSSMVFNIYYQYGLRMSERGLIRRFNNGDLPMPAPTIFSWQDALGILYSGQVIKVSQSHNLDVEFVLRNGNIINTKEPYIDEIFKEMKKCGRMCNNITPATE